jgi:Flavodoxin
MRALVVYESMYGNTHVVAQHIADGLRPIFEIDVVPVGEATPERVADADLVVAGGPTHAHGLSRQSTRTAAVEAAQKEGSDLELDADAIGPGLRDWFDGVGEHSIAAAAFDTRLDMGKLLTGRASRNIAHRLRRHGFVLVADPESFLVDKQTHLLDGQDRRASEWGEALARQVSARPLRHPAGT